MATAKKKQRFFDVEIPLIGRVTQLYAFELEETAGRFIKYDLTRTLKGKGAVLSAKIVVKDKEAFAVPRKIALLPFFLRRMVRKGTDYVEDSFISETKDALVEIKPFLITRRRVSRKVKDSLRKATKEYLKDYLKSKTYEEVFEDLVRNQLQKPLSVFLKKIYPLSLCEIRIFEVKKITDENASKSKPKKSKQEFSEESLEEREKSEESIEEKPKKSSKKTSKKSEEESE